MTGAGSFHRATQCFSHHKWCFLLLLFLGISFLGFCPEVTENLEENLNRETWKKIIIFLSWLLPLVSVLYCHPVRKVSLPYIQDTVIGTSTSWLPIKTMAFSLSCLFTSSISFTSQFLKKCRKTMENSDMLAPVHYDAKVTPQNPNTILNISHPWCACLSQRRHREQIKMFFSCGAQELPTCLITKKMLLMQYVTIEKPLHTLLMLHFFPLFFYLENKDTTFFYMWKALSTFTSNTSVYCFFCSEQQRRCITGSVCAVIWFPSFL